MAKNNEIQYDGILDESGMDHNFNESLPPSLRRSIWLIQDEEVGETYTADEILDGKPQSIIFDIRHSLYAAYKSGEYKYVCKHCSQPLGLKVRTCEGEFFPFFSHFQNIGVCPLKNQIEIDPTQSVREQENIFKTSALYQRMIQRLKEVLDITERFTNIEENKIISKPEIKGYRKPAIYSKYNDQDVCFDLLVSNPLISLLVGRNAFYKLHKMFYLWLFPSFTTKHQRLCQKDILYMNRRNVFVFDCKDFDNETNSDFCGHSSNPSSHLYAYEESIRLNRLMLNCYWQTPEVRKINGKTHINIKWNGPKLVAFDDLIYDCDNFELYYHDSDVDFYNTYTIEVQRQIDEWMKIKKDRWVKIFDSIEKRKILYAQLLAKRERKERLKYYYSLIQDGDVDIVVRYDEESKLYGFSVDDFDIIPPIYYDAKPFYCGYAWVRKKGKWGVIDYQNNRIINFQYSQLSELGNGLFYAYKNQKYILIDYKGEQKGSISFDVIEKLKDGLYKIGNVIVTGYDRGYIYGQGFYNSKRTKTLWGIINENGKEVLSCSYDSIGEFVDGKAKVSIGNKTGYIDDNGYEEYELSEEDDVIIFKSPLQGKFGLMDKNKNILITPIYDYIGSFCDGLAEVKIQYHSGYAGWGIIDKKGGLITDNVHNNGVKVLYGGSYVISVGNKYILKKIDDLKFSQEYDGIGKYDDKNIVVLKDGKWGIIDYQNNIVIPIQYNEIVDFDKNVIKIKIDRFDNRVAEINWECNERYPIYPIGSIYKYESHLKRKVGLMDALSNQITELDYDNIEYLNDDNFKAIKNGSCGIINKQGKTILSFEYNSIIPIGNGYSKIAQGCNWGVANNMGDIVVPVKLYEVIGIDDNVIRVKATKNSEIAELNLNGEENLLYHKYPEVTVVESRLTILR